ncbi:hypothetical protein QZH41_002272 [Actinostola sp. cb2023]|nr:hypothetical protein QZH41_002272 [Actinostola sp. cb2023]
MSIWRPFDDDAEDIDQEASTNTPCSSAKNGKERLNIRIGEKETEIVMEAYIHSGEQGWKSVLRETRKKIHETPINSRLSEFYIEGEDGKVLRRIKRIVREELKKQAFLYQKSQERRKKLEEQATTRGKKEMAKYTADTDSEVEDKTADVKPQENKRDSRRGKRGVIERQMRYAVKKTPGEKMKAKFSAFADSDENEEDGDEMPQPAKEKTLREYTNVPCGPTGHMKNT